MRASYRGVGAESGRPGLTHHSLSTGCSTLGFLRPKEKPEEKIEERIDRPPQGTAGPSTTKRSDTPSLPGQYSFRVAPYVFLSDFKISQDQPLFAELAQFAIRFTGNCCCPRAPPLCRYTCSRTRSRTRRT